MGRFEQLHDPIEMSIRNDPGKIFRLLRLVAEPFFDAPLGRRQELGLRLLRAQEVVGRDALKHLVGCRGLSALALGYMYFYTNKKLSLILREIVEE